MKKNIVITILAGAVFLLTGMLIGYGIGVRVKNTEPIVVPAHDTEAEAISSINSVDKIIDYLLPKGWDKKECSRDTSSIYISTLTSAPVDCSTTPDSQIKLSVNLEQYTECSDIPEKQDVKKHICISRYINGLRSLEAETEYLATSTYGEETYIKTYYIDSGKGIVKAEYIYTINSDDMAGFDNLVNSITIKK